MNTDIIGLLGAGSGINIKDLAEQLTAAERAPRQEIIDRNIGRTEARISGLSVLSLIASGMRDAAAQLNDRSDFNRIEVRNGAPQSFAVEAGTAAAPGSHSLEVIRLAQAQQTVSNGFDATDAALNGGEDFTLSLSVGSADAVSIEVSTATPQGVVNAINGKTNETGVSARLLDTGHTPNPWRIVLTGQTGAAKVFSLTSSTLADPPTPVTGLDFANNAQSAQDAELRFNGVTVTRSSNTIGDLIPGATVTLFGTASAARIDLTRNVANAESRIRNLVEAYNDAVALLDELGRREGGSEEFSGALAGQPILRQVTQQLRSLITGDSSTPGGNIKALRDVGVTLDRNGRLQVDDTRLQRALSDNFDDVVRMFSANTDNASNFGNFPRGLGGDIVKRMTDLLAFNGPLRATEQGFNRDLNRERDALAKLELRMEKVLERNIRQFTAMDSLVGELQSLRESLASQFENMSANLAGGGRRRR